MATLSSWTNDGRAMPFGLELAVGCLQRAMPIGRGMTFYVLAEEGAAVLAGPSPLPYYRVLIIYIYIYLKTINTIYNKIYILKRRISFSPYPFSIYILKRNYKFFVHFVFSAFY